MRREPNSNEMNDSIELSDAQTHQAMPRFPGQRGRQKRPTKVLVTMRFSREVLDYFKASGEGWQTRMNDVLKQYVAQQEPVQR